jgi:HAD superfamily phosphoserine phosphatase-like hydrolase
LEAAEEVARAAIRTSSTGGVESQIMTPTQPPKAFVSYSWDSPEHRRWVKALATRLRADGVDATLDQWAAAPGDQLPAFMETAVRENDFVVIVCTEKYRKKANERGGGVGYEGDIIAGELFVGGAQRKFIPVLASGAWEASAPSYLLGKFYIDLRNDPGFDGAGYQQLVQTLFGEREAAPPIGVHVARAAAGEPAARAAVTRERPESLNRYKVIAFDLDGTLLRGIEFSWTCVWEALGYTKAFARKGMQRYRRKTISYEDWCRWAVDMFRARGLTRDRLREIAGAARLTNNFRQAMKTLRKEGFVTVLVSGGIDTFLEDKIPEYRELFDHVFINRLQFDDNGFLTGVIATRYDFEGKAKAVEEVCAQEGFSMEQAVFVGEGFNDEHAASAVGLSIAYPPTAQGIAEVADVAIKEDDLMLILEHVITH